MYNDIVALMHDPFGLMVICCIVGQILFVIFKSIHFFINKYICKFEIKKKKTSTLEDKFGIPSEIKQTTNPKIGTQL